MDATRVGDLFEEAVAAAQDAAGRLGVRARDSTVLHRSNNVVVRINDVVLKVGTTMSGSHSVPRTGHAVVSQLGSSGHRGRPVHCARLTGAQEGGCLGGSSKCS